MKQPTDNANGFGAVEAILVLVLIIIIVVFGWLAYKHHHHASTPVETQNSTTTGSSGSSAPTSTLSLRTVSTSCFSTKVPARYSVDISHASNCALTVSNSDHSDLYEFQADTDLGLSANNLASEGKKVVTQGIETFSNYTLTNGTVGTFAGSPAYLANLTDSANGHTAVEAYVYHPSGSFNGFAIIHINEYSSADLKSVESTWAWK